jgi:hypothetical protein
MRSIDLPTERSTLISSLVTVHEILLILVYNRNEIVVADEDCAVKDIRKMH